MAEANAADKGLAIGIDLGTTYSCVAVYHNGKVEVIANEQGNFITPSVVAFNDYERLIGDAAKQQLARNAKNTIFDAKRMIGRKYNDPDVQADIKHWPFSVVEEHKMPKIEINHKGEVKRFSPVEVSAMVLSKMKGIADSYLNANVKNAVSTVPADFNDMQRKATKDAGTIAGLNVSCIINEPTAAAIAYGLENKKDCETNILVYDLGGGTFDVSIMNIRDKVFEVKATAGNSHLGGEDFDNLMVKHFADEFKRKNGIDIFDNKNALRRLRTECERAKRTLSSTTFATVEIDSLAEGVDFVGKISRVRFEDMCADLFNSTIATVEGTLKDAELEREGIDTVVLVGGSTRIPKIQQLLAAFFVRKEITKTVNPDEAVAYGAAIKAAIIHGNENKDIENVLLLEVTPLTLGIAVECCCFGCGDTLCMTSLIKRNTRIPVCRSKEFVTGEDNQTSMITKVLQGEHRLAKDNFEIGRFRIEGIPSALKYVEKVIVTFSIDSNGILTVSTVSEGNADAKGKLTIKNVSGSLTKCEIERMIADAEGLRHQDAEDRKFYTARWQLEELCLNTIKENETKTGEKIEKVLAKCREVMEWMQNCVRPDKAEFLQMHDQILSMTLAPRNEFQRNVSRKRRFAEVSL